MTDTDANIRRERIERLIRELEYEIVRGVMAREIEPDIHFSKIFPCVDRGENMARLDIHVSPATKYDFAGQGQSMPKLRIVENTS